MSGLSSLAATSALAVPKNIAGIQDVASSFGLTAHWAALSPSTSSLEALALPTNVIDRTASWLMDTWNVSSTTSSNTGFVDDPFRERDSSEDLVLSVNYPSDTREGSQFFMTPIRVDSNVQTAVLQYDVSFHSRFSWSIGS